MGKTVARAILTPLSIIDKGLARTALQAVAALAAFLPGGQIISAAAALTLGVLYKKKAPEAGGAMLSRLSATLDPATPRKMAFGETAAGADVIFVEGAK